MRAMRPHIERPGINSVGYGQDVLPEASGICRELLHQPFPEIGKQDGEDAEKISITNWGWNPPSPTIPNTKRLIILAGWGGRAGAKRTAYPNIHAEKLFCH